MKGRKPKQDAIRRPPTPADIVRASGNTNTGGLDRAEKPDEVFLQPQLNQIWDMTFGDGSAFKTCDVPMMTQYCWDTMLLQQIRAKITDTEDSSVEVLGQEDGIHGTVTTPSLWLKELDKTQSRQLKLADHLGISPLARARLGLTKAAEGSMMVNIAQTLREVVRESLE